MKFSVNMHARNSSVAIGLIVASIVCSVTAADGSAHSKGVQVGDLPSGDATGMINYTFAFEDTDGVPAGAFTGSLQAVDAAGTNIGDAVSFTSPDNLQILPISVDVTFG